MLPCGPEHAWYDGLAQADMGGNGVGGGGDGTGGGGGGIAIGVVEPQMIQPPLTTEPSEYQVILSPAFISTFEGPPLAPDQR